MALDQNSIDFLTELVENYYRAGNSFTSLDIANQAKQNGLYVRNRWVAEWLRSNAIRIAYGMGALFNQSLIEVESKTDGHTLAYLYHHYQVDPDSYLDRDQNPKPVSTMRNASSVSTPNSAAHDAAVKSGIVQNPTPPSPTVTKQHSIVTGNKQSPQASAIQRDRYGRFSSDPTTASVTKPTHFLHQKRDRYGRFVK